METRFILLGLGADPADYAAEVVESDETEPPAVLTYPKSTPDYRAWVLAFLLEIAVQVIIELPFELIFGGWG